MPGRATADRVLALPNLGSRESTAAQAAAELRAHIANGLLRPGDQLKEEAVAAQLGISRNSVREAFRTLSHEGLVVHSLHKGVFVRRVTAEDIRDIYRTRRLLEPLGLPTLARDRAAAARLSDIAASAEAAAATDDWAAVGTADINFHRALVEPCRSVRLDRLFAQLFAELRLGFTSINDARALHEPYLARNRTIAGLLVAGEVNLAGRELNCYLRDAERQVLAALPQE